MTLTAGPRHSCQGHTAPNQATPGYTHRRTLQVMFVAWKFQPHPCHADGTHNLGPPHPTPVHVSLYPLPR